ncbi:hypothetical protein CCACVL1_13818 [Corchorus capsularis]|uniref:Protein kinase domain-containing protein n=1 Tax=Corchorus capsularis TaxID=210143 RepID=A0A1R3I9F9_COCAP|nr:hypothetical protein CCACVL1_13818 [Corchorus capsularis]
MGISSGDIQVGPWNVAKPKGKKKKADEEEEPSCWIKFRFMGSCLSPRPKVERSISTTSTPYAESKSTNESNDTSTGQPVVPVVSSSTTTNAESIPSTPNLSAELKIASQLRKFSFNELKLATRSFRPESLLGEGGFGCVFKGWINEYGTAPVKPGTGLPVAVKTLNHDGLQGHREWLLIYVHWHLFVVCGLVILLLNVNHSINLWFALSEYVIEALFTSNNENHIFPGHLTSKSDVYSFGVVLLEMLTGRRSMDKNRPNGEHNLVEWARPCLADRRRFYRLIDPRLEGRFSIKGAQKAIQLAAHCLSRDSKSRPLMSEVVEILKPLPNLKDMACTSSQFQAMQIERMGSTSKSRTGGRVQAGLPMKSGQPTRTLSSPNGPQFSPYNNNHPHRSPKPSSVGQPLR